MHSEAGGQRILDLTRDSYVSFNTSGSTVVTHLPLGAGLNPWNRGRRPPGASVRRAIAELQRARAGRHDWVIVPPIHVDRTTGNPGWARGLKKALSAAVGTRPLARALGWLLVDGRCRYAIVDDSYVRGLSQVGLELVRPDRYFKRNLEHADDDRVARRPLPMALPDAVFDRAGSAPVAERPVDMFIAGDFKNRLRGRLLDLGRRLGERGWNVDIAETRIPFDEYLERMARAKIAGAVEGRGYHTWRMYEAPAVGTVPLVSPPGSVWSWFEDAVNCLVLPASVDEAVARVEDALSDPVRLEEVRQRACAQARRHHRRAAVGDYILASLGGDPGSGARRQDG